MKKLESRFPGKKILVVEDYFINRELIVEFLQLMDCEVDTAEDGVEAVNAFKANGYDLILMDIQMPKMDGYQATREIRKLEEEGQRVPIVAVTANAMEGDREKCLEAGMDEYLSKPIEFEVFEKVLKKFLS